MKRRWLIPLVLVLVLAAGTFGASAYFNSARQTTGYISSGTLDLKLGLTGDGPWANSVTLPWNFTNMAPGDEIAGNLWMKNVGTIDARQVTFEWNNVLNNPEAKPFADHIFLISAWDSKNTTEAISQFISMGDGIVPSTTQDGKISLVELAYLSNNYGWPFDAVSDVPPFLPPNSPQYLHLAFQFDPQAGNDLQGASLSYGLVITAEQKVIFPALVP